MSTSTLRGGGWSIEVHQEWIDITTAGPAPDPSWRYTDHAGHDHYYRHQGGYETLAVVVDEWHHCDGTDPDDEFCNIGWDWGWDDDADEEAQVWNEHAPHDVAVKTHQECPICHEAIVPDELPPFTPQQMPGMKSMRVTAMVGDGHERTCYVDREAAERFESADRDALGPLVIAYVTDCDPSMIADERLIASR